MFNNIKCNSDYSNAITSSNNQWNRSCVCRNKHYFDSKFRIKLLMEYRSNYSFHYSNSNKYDIIQCNSNLKRM